MTEPQIHSEPISEAMRRLLELAANLASSNLAAQPDDSETLLNVGWALETARVAGHHLAALASDLATPDQPAAEGLSSTIAAAGYAVIQRLSDDDWAEVYDRRPDSKEDCIQVCYSDGSSGHYLCEVTIDEATFPCLGCPLVRHDFADFHHQPDWPGQPGSVASDLDSGSTPRNPGPPARRMMLDLTDAVDALRALNLGDLPSNAAPRRRLTYIATALAQMAAFGLNIYYFSLMDMAQLDRDQAWRESEPQAERATYVTRELYEMVTGSHFFEPDATARMTRCERVFQARTNTEIFYCNFLDAVPSPTFDAETVGEMCQRCPFHQRPRRPSLFGLAST